MERLTLFADVILPLAVPNLYTYRIPHEWNDLIVPGKRVIVQFGKNKLYSAIVKNIHQTAPKEYQVKYIDSILDEEPIVNSKQFELWAWMTEYYLCHPGEVMLAALPSGLKLESETKLVLAEEYKENLESLNDKEYMIAEALEVRNVITLHEAAQIVNQKVVHGFIKNLIKKGVVNVYEEVRQKWKPKTESYVYLNPDVDNDQTLKEIFDKLEKRAFKQMEALAYFISEAHLRSAKEMRKVELTTRFGNPAIQQLITKKIFHLQEREIGTDHRSEFSSGIELNEVQQAAFDQLKDAFSQKEIALLKGVTGSGKTEIYIKLIQEALKNKKQVLYLLPEIALTTQIIQRLKKIFKEKIIVYHSKFTENERANSWNDLLKNNSETSDPFLIVGARSSVFLPFTNLGLVIVDEEHDASYKQQEPNPRYNGRDTAIMLAHFHKAKILLGTATPSVESFFNATSGKYSLIELNKRYSGIQMPEILIADLQDSRKRKLMKADFTPLLFESITEALQNKEQVILFQNRRGFAPLLECTVCSWTPKCTRCSVSLTYHKGINLLKCHYCGYSKDVYNSCGACGNPVIKTKGFGTEKIEEDLSILFPNVSVARMDLDSTRSKNAYLQIISDFQDRKTQILVGTQMVTKGLDFDNVGVVGVLNADAMLNFPDFRAFERAFQLMVQVSGRAGRQNKRGKVIIQTTEPYHPIIRDVIGNDFKSFYDNEILHRKNFHFPPFYKLISLTVKSKDKDVVNECANELANSLKQTFGNRLLGPENPPVSMIRDFHLKNILLKVEKELSMVKCKEILMAAINSIRKQDKFKAVRVVVDVDPL